MEYTNNIKAHIFATEQEAQQAIDLINEGEGIPISEYSVTRTYTEFKTYNEIVYIVADEVTQKYLGNPTDLEIEYTLPI
jgi:hypothetical protein